MGNSIFISNASTHNLYVKVGCDIEYQKVANRKIDAFGGLGIHVNKETQWSSPDKYGYTLVNRYTSMEFFPASSKGVCYVTIKFGPDDQKTICKIHPLQVKRGLIIDKFCHVHNAKNRKKWTDTDGIYHKPDPKNETTLTSDDDEYQKPVEVTRKGSLAIVLNNMRNND
ncbi:Hypothetical predicted protein [Mytilus galloprovincialis]|uniref:Uncharacterized protein n=1 Tax=Mytilus galloprovincialis TaxID=29158 RepID=A0A8B6HMU2_MYTGA|nr:Hypothetical predicted protein [Mytilus galloprovincialis]